MDIEKLKKQLADLYANRVELSEKIESKQEISDNYKHWHEVTQAELSELQKKFYSTDTKIHDLTLDILAIESGAKF